MIGIILFGLLSLSIVILLRRGKEESYSLDHAILNVSPPQTLWMNMGYWKVNHLIITIIEFQDTKSFPEACTALFRLLVARADIVPGFDILDVGCGCGDSTALLAELKPRTLRGVTSHKSQSELSRQRFPHIEFIHIDAVEYITSLPEESVDRIFAYFRRYISWITRIHFSPSSGNDEI